MPEHLKLEFIADTRRANCLLVACATCGAGYVFPATPEKLGAQSRPEGRQD